MEEPSAPDRRSWQFLFRTEAGTVDAGTWWRGFLILAAILAALTLCLVLVLPYSRHDLGETPLLSLSVLGANVFLIVYVFALILIFICFYNLSAKRWRAIGRPPALAGLLPFLALLAGAFQWLSLRAGTGIPQAIPIGTDIVFVVAFIWTIIDLGGALGALRRRD